MGSIWHKMSLGQVSYCFVIYTSSFTVFVYLSFMHAILLCLILYIYIYLKKNYQIFFEFFFFFFLYKLQYIIKYTWGSGPSLRMAGTSPFQLMDMHISHLR